MKASVYIATSLDGLHCQRKMVIWIGCREATARATAMRTMDITNLWIPLTFWLWVATRMKMVLSFGKWPYGNKWVVVMSSKPLQIAPDLAETVEAKSCSPAELVKELSERGAKHLYIDGGKNHSRFSQCRINPATHHHQSPNSYRQWHTAFRSAG